jgi:hypothetical protein
MEPNIAFLFGAGASRGVGEIEPFPPPLGSGLYDELVREFPETWGALADDEKGIFGAGGEGFESGMKLLWEKFDERAWAALIDMGIYFARFRPPLDQSDCYSRLVIALRALHLIDRTAVATLNYECLFEIASCRVGVNVNLSGQANPGTLAVAKPHGSCNFLADVNFQDVTLIGAPGVENLLHAQTTVVGNLDEIEQKYESGYSVPPVMSLFAASKHSPINAPFVTAMRDDWGRWATAAGVIVVVGAQPYFADAHIWNPVVAGDGAVWYIGGTGGDFDRLAKELGGRLDHLGDRFATSLKPLLERLGDFRASS